MDCEACHNITAGAAEVQCQVCKLWYHRFCLPTRILRQSRVICPQCIPRAAEQEEEGDTTDSSGYSQGADNIAPPVASSTAVGGRDAPVGTDALQVQIRQLQATVNNLRARAQANREMFEATVGTSRTTNHPNPSDSGRQRSSGVQEQSLWRSRLPASILQGSTNAAPLTREQIARRKTLDCTLPHFEGDPLKYFNFMTAYVDTAGDMCGFQPREDMKRIRDALGGPALQLVERWLNYPDKLDKVLDRLQQAYGQPSVILNAVIDSVLSLTHLQADLSNIAYFAGEVDHQRAMRAS